MIVGVVLLLLGEAGALPVMLGAVGGVESLVYEKTDEHGETFAAASVAVA